MRQYLIAIQFFTRVPVTGTLAQWAGLRPEMLRTSAAHLPGVGFMVGLQVPRSDHEAFRQFLDELAYPCVEETDNPVYRLFLQA